VIPLFGLPLDRVFLAGFGMIEDDERDGRRHKLDAGFMFTGNPQS
jgi:hypothetical protein